VTAAYYNEIDPYAAQWLRNLIAAGHIAPGEVDERSIEDVRPDDLAGFTQCHFFAGIGVWSLALRRAGWPDDRPVWTGSCPCQPFSAAGKGNGFADERHLWPAWFHIIEQCRPIVVFGEQVSSKDADVWIDLVQTDMEALGYAFGAVPFPSAGVGAPHIRDRLYWLADSASYRRFRSGSSAEIQTGWPARPEQPRKLEGGFKGRTVSNASVPAGLESGAVGDADNSGLEGFGGRHQATGGWFGEVRPVAEAGKSCGLADTNSERRDREHPLLQWDKSGRIKENILEIAGNCEIVRPSGPVNGFWRNVDWLFCRDGKWRPVEPGTFPLANGAPARVGRLRAYGNAINAEAAEAWVRAYMDCRP
jgi:DNA (cytosine-5)-methyltransferase 1